MKIGLAFDLRANQPPLDGSKPDDWYEEFDSAETIAAIRRVLESLGHTVMELGNGRGLVEKLLQTPPDLVFNLAEGEGTSRSREARVPAVCEMLNIPYIGSDPLTLGAALDKEVARNLVEGQEVLVPEGITLMFPEREYDGDYAEFPPLLEESGLSLPLIAKPAWEGSSKGIRKSSLIRTPEEFGPTVVALWKQYSQPVMVEEFIAGDEITVGLIGNNPPRVLGTMRIVPKEPTEEFIYSVEVKRDYLNQVNYESPANLPPDEIEAIEYAATVAYETLGCKDFARLDFRLRDGLPYFIEANPLPGLNPVTSDLVLLSKGYGIEFNELIQGILEAGITRLLNEGIHIPE
ncbi:D-alanine--D-alanine ligase family protein [Tuwongella immobilis]|uniref:D-alanine--D-alanine ligase n=1 Tax=Tuwongella immobilis TaxID=692036 RepID=A0A6C2YKE7_9BACT|nr:D-alanine--D-alanine ligase [Tuwongella immobilis]VIP01583.1 d-alanine--d-alanine ligase : D-alanine--D-alanine ligase OS=Singulisphaera acidiphila (strain ATCC BAA-1392 / DSM 18658 / VKM B-2454 / MOB10) GN=Sinac_6203 PE=4 SV=1: Dala_Dala_lig_C [Tuwongella immobilis]VTR98839.1 d-alanine--d-alanine ligase : D-alanine--D-alanine ligase OS=Singulisphaera acidiphila (strain ATCC BAA-1392 / DSM 18658 / VKM B-2454 / MOB10) GN=Sinac_6203 PE=4 SV=1: Dala_Dala_lig_C [Tuwongella immobilis]